MISRTKGACANVGSRSRMVCTRMSMKDTCGSRSAPLRSIALTPSAVRTPPIPRDAISSDRRAAMPISPHGPQLMLTAGRPRACRDQASASMNAFAAA